jgi:hypothetical protein
MRPWPAFCLTLPAVFTATLAPMAPGRESPVFFGEHGFGDDVFPGSLLRRRRKSLRHHNQGKGRAAWGTVFRLAPNVMAVGLRASLTSHERETESLLVGLTLTGRESL